MHTDGTLIKNWNRVTGLTDIWSHCWVGGFTGTPAVELLDSADKNDPNAHVIGYAVGPAYGVNGLSDSIFGGQHDRNDLYWEANIDPQVVAATRSVRVVNTYTARNRLQDILEQVKRTSQKLKDICAQWLVLCQ